MQKQSPSLDRLTSKGCPYSSQSEADHAPLLFGRWQQSERLLGQGESLSKRSLIDEEGGPQGEYSPQPDKIVDWVKEAYDKTAEMMEALGCRS